MAIAGHEFVEAYFFNNEKTLVESVWTDGKHNRTQHIEAKEGNKDWEDLLTRIDIDALHEATFKYIKRQNEAFEDAVITIAKKRGMVYDFNEQHNDIHKAFTQFLFGKFDPEEDKEKLFLYKLALFEADEIKQSKSSKKKKELRQAKNLKEATAIALSMAKS